MITLETIDNLIKIAKENASKAAEGASDYAGHNEHRHWLRLCLCKELLECGFEVEDHISGLLINKKMIVATNKRKWRMLGKNKWYWYSNATSLKKYL